jgi:glycosyltransferase involved in cell wall biosynthesis
VHSTESHIAVVIPIYNESQVIAQVLDDIKATGPYTIIVVDDGSGDKSTQAARAVDDVIVLRHRINRGKGAAVKTGIHAANELHTDCVVTMDGDGQHDPHDIVHLVSPILDGPYDVVLGTRMKNHQGMPLIKIIANKVGNLVTLILYGIYVSDSQSGFRAYSKNAAKIIDTKADKYEYDSKVIREINANRLSFTEVPISVRYTDYSKSKPQKQGFFVGIKTMVRMIWDLFA